MRRRVVLNFRATICTLFVLCLCAGWMMYGLTATTTGHGPTPPPDFWEMANGHGPTPPPDPWEVALGHGPTPPPDPWEIV